MISQYCQCRKILFFIKLRHALVMRMVDVLPSIPEWFPGLKHCDFPVKRPKRELLYYTMPLSCDRITLVPQR